MLILLLAKTSTESTFIMIKTELPDFNSLEAKLFPFMHDMVAGLHGWAADETSVRVVRSSDMLPAKLNTVHVGAGFGGDMQAIYTNGVNSRVGLEKDPTQIQLAEFLRQTTPEMLRQYLEQDPSVNTLYTKEMIADVAHRYCAERMMFDPKPLLIFECDVRNREQLSARLGDYRGMFNGMVGSIMMHWLVQGGFQLKQALDILGELLAPDSIAVFSVPFHFTKLNDPDMDERCRQQCMPDTNFYRIFTKTVTSKMSERWPGIPTEPFRMVPSLLMKQSELEAGSALMECVEAEQIWYDRTARIDLAMAGFGTYESSLRTRQPAAVIAPYVAEAIEVAKAEAGTEETSGTYVTFYTYRRR